MSIYVILGISEIGVGNKIRGIRVYRRGYRVYRKIN